MIIIIVIWTNSVYTSSTTTNHMVIFFNIINILSLYHCLVLLVGHGRLKSIVLYYYMRLRSTFVWKLSFYSNYKCVVKNTHGNYGISWSLRSLEHLYGYVVYNMIIHSEIILPHSQIQTLLFILHFK
jgi:hypothetical protein